MTDDEIRRRPGEPPIAQPTSDPLPSNIRMLLTILRGSQPIDDREKAAKELEKILSGDRTDYEVFSRVLEVWILENLVEERVGEMQRNGERPRGGRRLQALEEVARNHADGINGKSLQQRFTRAKRDCSLLRFLAHRGR